MAVAARPVRSESITKAGLANSSAKLCRPGAVVVVVRSGILKHTLPVAVLEREAAINQDLKCFDSGNDGLNAWLALALRSSARKILALNREGTTVQSVRYETLKDFELSVPPRSEQRCIVARIEELLAHVNAACERLAKVPKILKAFRQSVLAAACSGRLTEDWRRGSRDLEPARTILNGHPEKAHQWHEPNFEKRAESELPDGWTFSALGNLGVWGSGGTPSKSKPSYWDGGTIAWVSPKDMKKDFIEDSQDHVTPSALSQTNLKLVSPNTLLFVVRGMILAHTFPVAVATQPLTINQDIRSLQPHANIESAYLFYALKREARSILFAVRESTHGTRRLESETLKTWPIPLPPLEEQTEIVRRVEALFKLADAIDRCVQTAAKRADKLTQSILAKAFRGELVPTEAELARREGRDYEPAAVLLERIRAEREGQNGRPHTGKHPRSPRPRVHSTATEKGTDSQASLSLPEEDLDFESAVAPENGGKAAESQRAHSASSPAPIDALQTEDVVAAFRRAATGRGVMSRDELLKETSLVLGYNRRGSRITQSLKGHLRAAIRRRIIGTDGPTVWFETPAMDSYGRDELIETIRSVTRPGTTYDREDVIRAVANHLGFRRLRDTVRAPIQSAINGAIRRGILGKKGFTLWRQT